MLDEKILSILRNNTDSYVSGEELCKTAGISRAAIWKHIEKLRGEGYDIEALPHLGYRLVGIPDSLIASEIKWKLKTKVIGKNIMSYKKVDSTNDVVYDLAENGIGEGAVAVSEEQTKGKGRHGRQWLSPPHGGVYFSCVLRPEIAPTEIAKITLLAAVAVARSIRDVTGASAMIKWPNDILVNDKKVCGILTEMKAEQDAVDFVVVGIGINVNTPLKYLPKGASSLIAEIGGRAGEEKLSRIEVVRNVLEKLEEEYLKLKKHGFKPIIEDWKHFSAMIGSRVKVTLPNRTFEGLVHNLDSSGELVIRRDTGVLEKISSGDVVIVKN